MAFEIGKTIFEIGKTVFGNISLHSNLYRKAFQRFILHVKSYFNIFEKFFVCFLQDTLCIKETC